MNKKNNKQSPSKGPQNIGTDLPKYSATGLPKDAEKRTILVPGGSKVFIYDPAINPPDEMILAVEEWQRKRPNVMRRYTPEEVRDEILHKLNMFDRNTILLILKDVLSQHFKSWTNQLSRHVQNKEEATKLVDELSKDLDALVSLQPDHKIL